jgi:hypothetical protein
VIIECPICYNAEGDFVVMKDKDNIDIKVYGQDDFTEPPHFLKCPKCGSVFDFELDETTVIMDK